VLSIELDINGRTIGSIGVHNTQEKRVQTDDEGIDTVEVKYNVYDVSYLHEEKKLPEHPRITSVWHDISDGAAALTARVMEEVDEEYLDE